LVSVMLRRGVAALALLLVVGIVCGQLCAARGAGVVEIEPRCQAICVECVAAWHHRRRVAHRKGLLADCAALPCVHLLLGDDHTRECLHGLAGRRRSAARLVLREQPRKQRIQPCLGDIVAQPCPACKEVEQLDGQSERQRAWDVGASACCHAEHATGAKLDTEHAQWLLLLLRLRRLLWLWRLLLLLLLMLLLLLLLMLLLLLALLLAGRHGVEELEYVLHEGVWHWRR